MGQVARFTAQNMWLQELLLIGCLPSYIDNVYDIVHMHGARVVMIPLHVLTWWGHQIFINITETFTAPKGKRGFYHSYWTIHSRVS